MKICFLLHRKSAWLMHAMALELKEKYELTEFCGYVHSRKAEHFLRSRQDLSYTKLLVDEDFHNLYKNEEVDLSYLRSLEKKYGDPSLWSYVIVDRTIMLGIPRREYRPSPAPPYSHEDILKITQLKFRTIIKFLEEEKPDFLVTTVAGSLSTRILWHVAKAMGIKVISVEQTRIKNLIALSEDYLTLTGVEKIFEQLQKGEYQSRKKEEALKFLEEFRTSHTTYAPTLATFDERDRFKFLLPQGLFKSGGWFFRLSWEYLRGLHKNEYADENPWDFLRNRFKRKLRGLCGFSDLYDRPDWTEDFAFFQLHFEPELALMLYAPFWTDQINVARQIARSLPLNFKLYVREHRAMVNYRPRKYYRELKKIPNLKLLDPRHDLFDIIKASKLVTVITSTAGLEAALLGKPVITFGDVFFNKLSGVKKCAEIEKLPELVKAQLENFKPNDPELINYLAAVFEDSVEADYMKLWEEEHDFEKIRNNPGIKKLAGLIAKKLNVRR